MTILGWIEKQRIPFGFEISEFKGNGDLQEALSSGPIWRSPLEIAWLC
jgi:hypothetical protein